MKRIALFCLFALLFLSMPLRGQEEIDVETPLIASVKTRVPPVLDGKLNDACWKRAVWTEDFFGRDSFVSAKRRIRLAVVHTQEAVYFGLQTSSRKKGAGAKPVYFAFFFIRPDLKEKTYYEFVCSHKGMGFMMCHTDKSWHGKAEGKARLTSDGWSMEAKVPFKLIGRAAPKPGEVWGFSPGCKDPNDHGPTRYAVWADVEHVNDVENFGRLVFVEKIPPRAALKKGKLDKRYYVPPLRATPSASNVRNGSFERGLYKWHVRFSERTYGKEAPAVVTEAVKRDGKQSVCITSTNPDSLIQIINRIPRLAGGRYEISCFLRLEKPSLRDGVNLFVSARSRADVRGAEIALKSTFVDDTPQKDGWRRQAIRFEVPPSGKSVQLGVEVIHYVGKVWVDDFRLTRCEGKLENDGLWFWDARQPNDDGMAPRLRLFDMIEKKSPWVDRAQRYNDVLVEAAFARDRLGQLERAWVYNAAKPDESLRTRVARLYELFDKLDRSFVDLYVDKKADQLEAKIDPLLGELERRTKQLRAALDAALDAERRAAHSRAGDWPAPPPAPKRERYRVAPDGSVKQLVFGKWSKWRYYKLGRALDLWDHTSGTYDWNKALDILKQMQAVGIETIGLGTGIMCGGGQRCPKPRWWRQKYGGNRAVVSKSGRLNLWHPAVLELHTSLVREIGQKLRGQPDILFYHYAWESSGPGELSPKETDPAKSYGLASLQDYLKRKYGSIRELNKAWGGKLRSFREINTGLLKDPAVGAAFQYDYQLWRQDSYIEHCRAIYREWKKADPETPVLAAHSGLMSRIDPTRIFETADLVNHHGGWRLAGNLYLASTAPLEKKHLCKYENFWQYQEQANRWGDERAQYAAIAKYLYRNALTGEVLQTWCFPYTSQKGWNWRQAQWCQTRDDYLTLRYSASALPVAKRRVENLQHIFFLGARRDFSDFLVVWPRTSWLRDRRAVRNKLRDLVVWLHGKGLVFEYRNEQRISSGVENLDAFNAVLLPFAPYLKRGVDEKLLRWVRAGGALVTFGPAGVYDEYGRPSGRLMAETVGVVPVLKEGAWDFGEKFKDVAVIRRKVGKGSVAVVTLPLPEFFDNAAATGGFLRAIHEGSKQFARSDGDVFEFYRRIAPDGTRFLAVLNPNPDAPVTATVTLRGRFKRVLDVDVPGGLPAPIRVRGETTSFPLRLQPAGMTVLRMDK